MREYTLDLVWGDLLWLQSIHLGWLEQLKLSVPLRNTVKLVKPLVDLHEFECIQMLLYNSICEPCLSLHFSVIFLTLCLWSYLTEINLPLCDHGVDEFPLATSVAPFVELEVVLCEGGLHLKLRLASLGLDDAPYLLNHDALPNLLQLLLVGEEALLDENLHLLVSLEHLESLIVLKCLELVFIVLLGVDHVD